MKEKYMDSTEANNNQNMDSLAHSKARAKTLEGSVMEFLAREAAKANDDTQVDECCKDNRSCWYFAHKATMGTVMSEATSASDSLFPRQMDKPDTLPDILDARLEEPLRA